MFLGIIKILLLGNFNLTKDSSGRLWLTHGTSTWTICQGSNSWGNTNAHVACTQLGYYGGVAISVPVMSNSHIVSNIACSGTESNIFQCSHNYLGSCPSGLDVAVSCCK